MKNEIIGNRVKAIRKARGLTQDEFAKSLGYSDKSVISHIEKGDSDMTYEKILLLLRTYCLDANELFDVSEIDKRLEEWEVDKRKDKKVVVYIHGLYGSATEAKDSSFLEEEYDVIGLDYQDANPWELKGTIRNEFEKITKNYKEVVVIANSIGAFYAYEYLSDFNIKQAFFISPIVDMHQIILGLMMQYHVSKEELKEKKEIKLENGQTLSYDFYLHTLNYEDSWTTPTDILYGSRDELVYIENIVDFLTTHPNAKLTIKQGAKHYFHTKEEKEFIKNWILNVLH